MLFAATRMSEPTAIAWAEVGEDDRLVVVVCVVVLLPKELST